MPAAWKTVRVFISSTFRDMHAERDYLVKVVFPRLRQWCNERRLHLIDIDLRWGVTKEEADDGKAIEICLREIDGCRPFFLCIMGNRYGWVPDELPAEEVYQFRGLQTETQLSITHMEILHAAFRSIPVKDVESRAVCQQAFFYFRDPDCLPNPSGLLHLTAEQRAQYRQAFFELPPKPGGPDRRAMLDNLKNEIRQRFASEDRVFDYTGTWDTEAENPEDDEVVGRLTDLENFGLRVEADIQRGITEQLAEYLASLVENPSPLQDERSLHEAFIENHAQIHVPRADVERELAQYVENDDRRPLVLLGPPGCGKSAILAHWIRENVNISGESWTARWDDVTYVIPRFIGASASSTSLHRLMANIGQELVQCFGLLENSDLETTEGVTTTQTPALEIPADPVELRQKWPKILDAASEQGSVVLVLDAINQLNTSADPLRLSWLPQQLPPRLKLIVSVLDHGDRSRPDYEPSPDEPEDWLRSLRQIGIASTVKKTELPVPELDDEARRRIIQDLPSVFCKRLEPAQIDLLLENEATRNPLFLLVALEELRVFGSFDRLPVRIAELPRIESSGEIDGALDAIFGQVLNRLERETDRQIPGLVSVMFRLLALAREGLSELELSELLARHFPYVPDETRDWATHIVLRQLRQYLMRKGTGQVALIDFFHHSFWKAVSEMYLNDTAVRADSHREVAKYFQSQSVWIDEPDTGTARDEKQRIVNQRRLAELPYQLLHAAEWIQLVNVLHDLSFLEAANVAGWTFSLLSDCKMILEAGTTPSEFQEQVSALATFLRRYAHLLIERPYLTFQYAANQSSDITLSNAAELRWTRGIEFRPWFRWTNPPGGLSEPILTLPAGVPLVDVHISADKRRLLSAGADGSARLWDLNAGEPMLSFAVGSEPLVTAQFCMSGKRIVASDQNGVTMVWDARDGGEIGKFGERHGRYGEQLLRTTRPLISADGNVLVTYCERNVWQVWDVETKELRGELPIDAKWIASAISPDSLRIAVGASNGCINVYCLSSLDLEIRLAPPSPQEDDAYSLTFSPNGKEIAAGYSNNYCVVWQIEGQQRVDELTVNSNFGDIVFSDNGRFLFCVDTYRGFERFESCKCSTYIVDRSDGRLRARLEGQSQRGIAVNSACTRVLIPDEKDALLYALDLDETPRELGPHGTRVVAADLSMDGNLAATAGRDGVCHVWDVSRPQSIDRGALQHSRPYGLCSHGSGQQLITSGEDNRYRIWSRSNWQKKEIRLHAPSPSDGKGNVGIQIDCSSDGTRLLVAGIWYWTSGMGAAFPEPECRLIELESGKELGTIPAANGVFARFAPSGSLCVVTCSNTKRRDLLGWDLVKADSVCQIYRCTGSHVAEFTKIARLGSQKGKVLHAAFSHDETRILTGDAEGTAKIWELPSGRLLHNLSGHLQALVRVAFSRDDRFVVTASTDGTVKIWSGHSYGCTITLSSHIGAVTCISISHDNQFLATGGLDRTIRLWDLRGEKLLATFVADSYIVDLMWAPVGTDLIACTGSGRLLCVHPEGVRFGVPVATAIQHWLHREQRLTTEPTVHCPSCDGVFVPDENVTARLRQSGARSSIPIGSRLKRQLAKVVEAALKRITSERSASSIIQSTEKVAILCPECKTPIALNAWVVNQ